VSEEREGTVDLISHLELHHELRIAAPAAAAAAPVTGPPARVADGPALVSIPVMRH